MLRFGTMIVSTASFLVATLAFAACGGSDSSFQDLDAAPDVDADSGQPPGDKGGPGQGGTWADGGMTVEDAGPRDAATTDPGCASAGSEAKPATVNLVFMFDRSGSMVVDQDTDAPLRAVKWDPIVAAAKAFFGDGQSKGMNASLTFFSQQGIYFPDKAGYCGAYTDVVLGSGYTEACCSAGTYSSANVVLRALPSADFSKALDDSDPAGATPTYPAMQGAVAQAVSIANDPRHEAESTVIVLATDGNPKDFCNDESTVAKTAEVAAKAARDQRIKTYVIGVNTPGQDGLKDNLDTIARSGGTGQAFIVNVDDANATKKAFLEALNKIRAQVASCDVAIPAPPEGKTFDKKATNVLLQVNGQATPILFNETCGDGWRYDNWDDPKAIKLCPAACTRLRSSGGSLGVQFGCPTQTPDGPIVN
ncbi:VWA domain-containing protein [Pendulispora rubella]|uniref:VWA domain-containing protein n=1 Tax=Pendulispora rubella TaxID=2741070 RepID=A0ABZ2KV54_9BACT